MAVIVERGLHTMYGPGSDPSQGDTDANDEFTYMTVYNEPWVMPAQPGEVTADDIMAGMYRFAAAPDGMAARASVLFSGPSHLAASAARDALAARGIGVELWSVPGWKQLREEGLDAVRWNRLHPGDEPRIPLATRLLAGDGPVVAVTDYLTAVPDQISRFVPASRPFVSLGTDGYGRSDDRAAMRRFFEVDAASVEVAVLDALAASGSVDPSLVAAAIADHGLDTSDASPRVR
jgi:pyruvate dehydrogenase E1 component